MTDNARLMEAALAAGQTNKGQTWPNPTVGCVLVDPAHKTIIATGVTQKGGRPHAEMDALAKAGPAARGSHAYVTLEPCNHASADKPCSCTDGLIQAGVTAVVIAMPDPDSRMAGQSIAKLKAAGIDVQVGIHEQEAAYSHRGHISRVTKQRPFITLKIAHSQDGKIGIPNKRTAITGDASWQRTYAWRGQVDAVLVGITTALVDDPQLTDRRNDARHQPVRVVLDTQGRLPATSVMAQTARSIPLWVVSTQPDKALEDAGARLITVPANANGHLDIKAAISALFKAGLSHILVEAGATLGRALLDADLVDEVLMIEGNVTLGENGIPAPVLPANMVLKSTEHVGPDIWRVYEAARFLESGIR